jgi:transcriptional regulator with GAF, ATPase, and Fis domain
MRSVEQTDRDDTRPPEQGDAGAHGLKSVLEGIERDLILRALLDSRGNKAKAARALGITERFMGIRVKRLGIDWRGLRTSKTHPREHTA